MRQEKTKLMQEAVREVMRAMAFGKRSHWVTDFPADAASGEECLLPERMRTPCRDRIFRKARALAELLGGTLRTHQDGYGLELVRRDGVGLYYGTVESVAGDLFQTAQKEYEEVVRSAAGLQGVLDDACGREVWVPGAITRIEVERDRAEVLRAALLEHELPTEESGT